jgi:hypothetical protein
MKNFTTLFVFIMVVLSARTQELWVKNNTHRSLDSLEIGVFMFNPYASAFFDDVEFVSNIKKGYTYPGFFVQPQFVYQPNKRTRFTAGFNTLYFAGSDTVERLVPVLSLEANVLKGVNLILGTIHSGQLHFLPEPLFKPERLFTSQPETGLQFLTTTERLKVDSWTNWERYIKQGSPFQEVFTMGFSGIIKPSTFKNRTGLTLNFFGFGVHHGGQIDSTNLDVNTMINLGAGFSYCFPIGSGKSNLGTELTGFLSSDKSPNPSSKYLNGKAVYPKLFVESNMFRGELGYWYSSSFVNPRGEELFGSYSTVKPEFDSKIRNLVTAKLIYSTEIAEGFNLSGRFETYYDIKSSILDWAFTLRMVFDREIKIKSRIKE